MIVVGWVRGSTYRSILNWLRPGGRYGAVVAYGDFNGDYRMDAVVGAPGSREGDGGEVGHSGKFFKGEFHSIALFRLDSTDDLASRRL